jgi:hypothetical protein
VSARDALVAGVAARLRGLAGVAVFDAAPLRAGLPFVQVEEPVLAEWGGTGFAGREGRLSVLVIDDGERPVRTRALMAAVEACLAAMPAALPDGWRLVQLRLSRGRLVKAGERWTGAAEFVVRMARVEEGEG